MNFADLAAGDTVFVDANILVYYFGADPLYGAACAQLFQRIENKDLLGMTSTHVLSEMAHRLMTTEAIRSMGWPIAGIAHRLRTNPNVIGQLTRFRQAVDDILNSQFQVLTIPPALIASAAAVSPANGLLSNDALIVAVMQANGLTKLASTDADFDRVPGLIRYAPV